MTRGIASGALLVTCTEKTVPDRVQNPEEPPMCKASYWTWILLLPPSEFFRSEMSRSTTTRSLPPRSRFSVDAEESGDRLMRGAADLRSFSACRSSKTRRRVVSVDFLGTYADWRLSTFSQAERDR